MRVRGRPAPHRRLAPLVCASGGNVRGPRDLDGDGKSDILWQSDDGKVGASLMDGTAIGTASLFGAKGEVTWDARVAGDFNGDGRDDILWQSVPDFR
jgi:hypothetical protein